MTLKRTTTVQADVTCIKHANYSPSFHQVVPYFTRLFTKMKSENMH